MTSNKFLLIACVVAFMAFGGFATAQPVTIEMWMVPTVTEAGPPPSDWEFYKIAREKLNINVKLVLEPSTTVDQDTKLNTAAAANRLPDLFEINRDPWVKLVKAGVIGSTDELWKKIPTRVAKYYSDPEMVKLVTLNGKKYGLPDSGSAIRPVVEGLVIRKDWLDKLKLKMPTTTEELVAVAKAFTEQDPDGNGKADTYGFGAFIEQSGLMDAGLGRRFYPIMGAYGVPILWNTQNQKDFGLNLRKPQYVDALRFVKRMVDTKAIFPDWATLKKDDFRLSWKQGKFGIMFEQFSALLSPANYGPFDKSFPHAEWVPVPAIKGPNGLSANSVAIKNTHLRAVSKKAANDPKKVEAIARLLEWMSTDEAYYLLGYGKKGVNFNLDASGDITYVGLDPKKITTAPEMATMTQIRNTVYRNDEAELIGRYPAWKSLNGRTIEPYKLLKYFNTQPSYNGTAATFINAPEKAADIQRYINENIVRFVLGLQPFEKSDWDTFLKGLDALGGSKWEKDAKAYLIANSLL